MEDKKLYGEPGEALERGKCNDCCCPLFNVYVIFAECLTINNGACPDWDFCDLCPEG